MPPKFWLPVGYVLPFMMPAPSGPENVQGSFTRPLISMGISPARAEAAAKAMATIEHARRKLASIRQILRCANRTVLTCWTAIDYTPGNIPPDTGVNPMAPINQLWEIGRQRAGNPSSHQAVQRYPGGRGCELQHPPRRDPGLCRSQRRRIDPGLRPCPADGFGGWGFSAAEPVRIGRHTAGVGPVGGAGQPYSCAAGYQDRPACRVAR